MMVYLLPVGRGRFELYSEPADDTSPPHPQAGRLRHWAHRSIVRWRDLVDTARRGESTGRLGRWRDRLVCRLAESIAGQRTLWALASVPRATLLVPTTIDSGAARGILDRLLSAAKRHHSVWLAVDAPIFVVSAALVPIPGPNVVAYYLAFRLVGHFLAWRGARQSLTNIEWRVEPHPKLTELEALVGVPRATRAEQVAAIAQALELSRLAAFFERVAA